MTCALIMITSSLWVNPCNVQYMHPWVNADGENECVLVFRDNERHATTEKTCSEIANQ